MQYLKINRPTNIKIILVSYPLEVSSKGKNTMKYKNKVQTGIHTSNGIDTGIRTTHRTEKKSYASFYMAMGFVAVLACGLIGFFAR